MKLDAFTRPFRRIKSFCRRYSYYWNGGMFDGVEKFCLFIGYPRSGHTLIGAFIDAHPDAVMGFGNELSALLERGATRNHIYSDLMERARVRRRKPTDRYKMGTQWQGGRHRRLRLVGQKRAGESSRMFAAKLELLGVLRERVGVPLKVIHVVRNPYDNITTISRKHDMSLPQAIDYYFYMCAAVRVLRARLDGDELITIRQESVIADPKEELSRLFEFLSLETDEQFLNDCAKMVYEKPHQSRYLLEWTDELKGLVEQRIREYPYLSEYTFDH
jgi:hypothetical protein